MNNSFLLALSTLVGTIVGAGIFGLPYVISKSGVIPGIFYFVVLGGVVMLLHLLFGEICLRTNEKHRLMGYASMYLGVWAQILAAFATIVGSIGALLVYIIFGGHFLTIAASPFIHIPNEIASFVFWIFLSLCVLGGIRLISRLEFLMSLAMLGISGVIFFFALPHFTLSNLSFIEGSNIFLPYGVILFSLVGWSAIPEIADLFKNHKQKRTLDNLIVLTFAAVTIFYVLFAFLVAGVSGPATSENALDGLKPVLGDRIVFLGSIFGLFALATSFLVVGNYLKNSLRYDVKLSFPIASAIAALVPFGLFLLGLRDVIMIMGVLGAFLGAVEGALIVLIYQKAKKKSDRVPEYKMRVPGVVLFVLLAVLCLGALAEVFITR